MYFQPGSNWRPPPCEGGVIPLDHGNVTMLPLLALAEPWLPTAGDSLLSGHILLKSAPHGAFEVPKEGQGEGDSADRLSTRLLSILRHPSPPQHIQVLIHTHPGQSTRSAILILDFKVYSRNIS
eukprot:1393499-Amorphochlora_amoeboformis.AAC.1